jgi:hypothetical protein
LSSMLSKLDRREGWHSGPVYWAAAAAVRLSEQKRPKGEHSLVDDLVPVGLDGLALELKVNFAVVDKAGEQRSAR